MARKEWRLPILGTLLHRIRDLSPDEDRALAGCLVFLDAIDQLRIHHYAFTREGASVEETVADEVISISVEYKPWSPHFHLTGSNRQKRKELEHYLQRKGVHVRRLPHFKFFKGKNHYYQVVLNAATLMESYAISCELNHIVNALRIPLNEALSFLPPGNEYHSISSYLISTGLCTAQNLMPTLAVCIDVALMYDPFVLYNVPWDSSDQEGRHDQYPGETFLAVCDALKTTAPLIGNSREEADIFYKALCKNAGLPDPNWMAEKSYKIAASFLSKGSREDRILAKAVKAHCNALKYRCKIGATSFPLALVTTEHLYKVLELARPVVSFYNVRTRQREHFDPRKVDCLSIHSILLQAISEPVIECPLKRGRPFFCDSAELPSDKLCVWKHAHGTSECFVDILERLCGFTSSG
jgi:hypothetical protein